MIVLLVCRWDGIDIQSRSLVIHKKREKEGKKKKKTPNIQFLWADEFTAGKTHLHVLSTITIERVSMHALNRTGCPNYVSALSQGWLSSQAVPSSCYKSENETHNKSL